MSRFEHGRARICLGGQVVYASRQSPNSRLALTTQHVMIARPVSQKFPESSGSLVILPLLGLSIQFKAVVSRRCQYWKLSHAFCTVSSSTPISMDLPPLPKRLRHTPWSLRVISFRRLCGQVLVGTSAIGRVSAAIHSRIMMVVISFTAHWIFNIRRCHVSLGKWAGRILIGCIERS